MANQRKAGVARITVTLTEDILAQLENEAEAKGVDRLKIVREAVIAYLESQRSTPPRKRKK